MATDQENSQPSESALVRNSARIGLAARGLAHLLIGGLALLVAKGQAVHITQRSALTRVLLQPYGTIIVGFIAVGFAAYAVWRFFEAWKGVAGKGKAIAPRLLSLGEGIVSLVFAFSTVGLLIGTRRSPWRPQDAYTARFTSTVIGRWILVVAAFAILGFGLWMIWQAVVGRYMRDFPDPDISPEVCTVIRIVGGIGNGARGIVFVATGTVFAVGARDYGPIAAAGMDGAINAIKSWPFGDILMSVTAWGLVAFGIYGLFEAFYRRV